MDTINIEYISKLARLELTEEEKVLFSDQLTDFLEHFDKLKTVDVSNIEPMFHTFPMYNVWQEDIPGQCLARELVLKNAPESRDNQVCVPQIMEE